MADVPTSSDAIRSALEAGICPYCAAGPFRVVLLHTTRAHGIEPATVKAEARVPTSHHFACDETRSLLSDAALRNRSVDAMAGARRVRGTLSEAGRDVFRVNVKRANAARTRIPLDQHERIRERLADGELKRDLAVEYGVGVARLRQIEQGISYRQVRST